MPAATKWQWWCPRKPTFARSAATNLNKIKVKSTKKQHPPNPHTRRLEGETQKGQRRTKLLGLIKLAITDRKKKSRRMTISSRIKIKTSYKKNKLKSNYNGKKHE